MDTTFEEAARLFFCYHEAEIMAINDLRVEYSSDWRVPTQHDNVGYILDALMDSLPSTEYSKTELAEQAGMSRQSVHTYFDLLLALEILEPVEVSSPQRFRVNSESEILTLLHQVGYTNPAG